MGKPYESPTTTAVVLNWNQAALTLKCVACLRQQVDVRCRIVLVDNGSRPEEQALLRDGLAADVQLVQLPANRGFAGGMNVGIAEAMRAKADYVWLVNDDAFSEQDCLARLLTMLETDPCMVAVGPKLVGTDGEEQHAGGRFDPMTSRSDCVLSEEFPADGGGENFWVIGTAPLFRLAPLLEVGGFDERYFAYMEEIDLCLRLGGRGGRFGVVPSARVTHLGHASTGGGFPPFALYLHTRNQLRLCRSHMIGGRNIGYTVSYIRGCLDHAGCFVANGQPDRGRAVVQALFAILSGETGAPKWFNRMPQLADFLARHPWQIIRALDLLQRFIGPKPAKGVSA